MQTFRLVSFVVLLLVLGVFLPLSQMGCGRNIVSFGIAAGSLIRPVLDLEMNLKANGNLRRIFNRVRWLEQIREWEVRLQVHALQEWLGRSAGGRIKQCGANCSSCFSGDQSVGQVALPCWSQSNGPTFDDLQEPKRESLQLPLSLLSGVLHLEVPTLSKTDGEGFMTWEQVCSPATKKLQPEAQDGLCITGGLSGYQVRLNDVVAPVRLDVLWVVRAQIVEGCRPDPSAQDATCNAPNGQQGNLIRRRLDGVIGILFDQREDLQNQAAKRRRAILLEEKNALYDNFQTQCFDRSLPGYRGCCGSFQLFTSEGQHFCGFVGAQVPAAQRNCWDASLQSVETITIGAFDVRCRKK